jgi:hypothetical protein
VSEALQIAYIRAQSKALAEILDIDTQNLELVHQERSRKLPTFSKRWSMTVVCAGRRQRFGEEVRYGQPP